MIRLCSVSQLTVCRAKLVEVLGWTSWPNSSTRGWTVALWNVTLVEETVVSTRYLPTPTTWPRHSSWCCSSCTGSARGWGPPAAPWWDRAARSSRWSPRSPTCSSWRSSSCRTSRLSRARSSWTLVNFSKERFELDMIGMQPYPVHSALATARGIYLPCVETIHSAKCAFFYESIKLMSNFMS